uniref:Uncharacterized protein n=1 Tax=Meloidogyne enterolobii TaxID=390850 RepID=A0A6V7XFD5_MELEN|nr:unnamed protein product [Meloidogyne enterolobii]
MSIVFIFLLLFFVASFPIKLAEGMDFGSMRSGQKQPLIEPPDNRTFFCLTELSFLIIILINTKDDELFGFYETDGDDIKTVPVYALFERIGEEKTRILSA